MLRLRWAAATRSGCTTTPVVEEVVPVGPGPGTGTGSSAAKAAKAPDAKDMPAPPHSHRHCTRSPWVHARRGQAPASQTRHHWCNKQCPVQQVRLAQCYQAAAKPGGQDYTCHSRLRPTDVSRHMGGSWWSGRRAVPHVTHHRSCRPGKCGGQPPPPPQGHTHCPPHTPKEGVEGVRGRGETRGAEQ